MGAGIERVLQRLVLRTGRSPLRHIWRASYAGVARAAAAYVAPGDGSAYLAGSFAGGEPVLGLSDIDLVVVARDARGAQRAASRAQRLRRIPVVRRLVAHIWTYDDDELRAVLASSAPLYGIAAGSAAFLGPDAPTDAMGLLDRPGVGRSGNEWRLLRGAELSPWRARSAADPRLAAWLELQYRWRYAFLLTDVSASVRSASKMSTLVAAVAQTWLMVEHGERVSGRRAPLNRAAVLLADEREPLLQALRVHDELHRNAPESLVELWGCFTRLSVRIADHLTSDLAFVDRTHVELAGELGTRSGLPLLDWRGLAVPRAARPTAGLAAAVDDRFQLESGDPTHPAVIADAASRTTDGRRITLRRGGMLVRPTYRVWKAGRLRGYETRDSDPVSFALIEHQSVAAFPNVPGWSAGDRARRAVAEHRGWLSVSRDRPARGPLWADHLPLPDSPTPATVGFLFSAARAALFAESIAHGAPRLPLDADAVVATLVQRGDRQGEAGRVALAAKRACEDGGSPMVPADVQPLLAVVRLLPSYRHGACT